jgi:2-phosphosulfolactate phosphatase
MHDKCAPAALYYPRNVTEPRNQTDPRNQTRYQVRFDWGLEGAAAIAPGAHIIVWVDALPSGPDPTTIPHKAAIVTGNTGSRRALARWVLDQQTARGDRAIVAVVAAGGAGGRFAVEDLLAAGAIVDALADVGIDDASPEAASAAAAYAGLQNAAAHLLTASVAGQELLARGDRDTLDAARDAAAAPEFGILKEFSTEA